ncbi:hypothetical protein GO730_10580 [Spirosoma sp. HMF3257]|uniref:Uncharacterized protein n=1 Tax=Spirosoma telluris TaxID=2183553 RepID=A0A327NIC5_9BACT|nr:hypothetical protein [Spirosoma telluris]RAI74593.1 hypothetical protein HMF3257_10510 [Spirosoma telluris]
MNVEHALNAFYELHGYGEEGGINKKWDMIKFGPISLPLPNLESRRRNIYLHDINHLVTGYDTTWKGEASVTSWEIATGGWGNIYFAWWLTLWGMAVGVMFYPKYSYNAFQAGLRMKSAFTSGLTKQEMYSLSIDQLKSRLHRTETEINHRSYFLWASLSLLVWFAPFLLGFVVFHLL